MLRARLEDPRHPFDAGARARVVAEEADAADAARVQMPRQPLHARGVRRGAVEAQDEHFADHAIIGGGGGLRDIGRGERARDKAAA